MSCFVEGKEGGKGRRGSFVCRGGGERKGEEGEVCSVEGLTRGGVCLCVDEREVCTQTSEVFITAAPCAVYAHVYDHVCSDGLT